MFQRLSKLSAGMRYTLPLATAFVIGTAVGHFKPLVREIRAAVTETAKSNYSDDPVYRARVPIVKAFSPASKIVMTGDSLTMLAEWSDILGTAISNQGVGNDTVDGLLSRIDSIAASKPAKVFLMIGINDIRFGRSADQIASSYAEVVRRLAPAKVYVQSTLFAAQELGFNSTVAQLNERLRTMCEQNCTFIDLNAVIAPNNDLKLSIDGIHLNPEAYALWRDAIRPYL